MDPNTFTNLVIVLMIIIIVFSTIKIILLRFILDKVEEIIEVIFCEPGQSDRTYEECASTIIEGEER